MSLATLDATPLLSDPIRIIEVRILNAIRGGGGGTGGAGVVGSVDPEGSVVASPGTTYWNQINQTFWVKETGTGNTGWRQLI